MNPHEFIKAELASAAQVLNDFLADDNNLKHIAAAGQLMVTAIQQGCKLISCGNGGSSCDAMHFSEELTGKYREPRKAIAALSITEPGHLTCVGNDYGYAHVFSRYLEALGKEGDVLLAITTSGNSENVVNAAKAAKSLGMKVVGLTGKDGGKLAPLCDVEIRVPHYGYADRVQEVHIKVIHILMGLIEQGIA
ncbi:MAG TPA: D-sedoheptulose 7-phosphate isomerase [Cytophagales bacterium]|nr:D-sedoheptulose 7-phosphate isomerase [Cytophagales bacterium]